MSAATPAAADTGQLIIQVLLTLGIGGILTTVANAFLSRRKTAADVGKTEAETEGARATATSLVTDSAVSLLKAFEAEAARSRAEAAQGRAEIAEVRKQMAALDREVNDLRNLVVESQTRERGHVRQLTAYRTWAELASQKLSDAGIQIDPPPHEVDPPPPLPPLQRRPPI